MRKYDADKKSIHAGDNIDAIIESVEYFSKCLQENSFLELVIAFIPNTNIVFESQECQNLRKSFKVDRKRLVVQVLEESERDWNMSRKQLEKMNTHRGKKILLHCLRMLVLTNELLDHQTISFTASNQIYHELIHSSFESNSWIQIETKYGPMFEEMRKKLNNA